MPRLNGHTHINLTVRDLDRSSDWYCRTLGFVPVRDAHPEESGFRFRTLVHSESLAAIVLGQAAQPAAEPFDEQRVGLHHVGYHVPDRADLDEWAERLDALSVDNTGVKELFLEAGYGIWFRDPDNIWLELYWVNANFFIQALREQWKMKRGRYAQAAPDPRRSGRPMPRTRP